MKQVYQELIQTWIKVIQAHNMKVSLNQYITLT